MKLAAFLAAFAYLGLVTATRMPAGLPASPRRALLKHGTQLVWWPRNTYDSQQQAKLRWEQACDQALNEKGCGAGILFHGRRKSAEMGQNKWYINVKGASSMEEIENGKKMRVFQDGSTVDGWLASKKPRKKPEPLVGQNTLLFWDPETAYKKQAKRKSFWEGRCGAVLARNGCQIGMIHKGEIKSAPDGPNGKKITYVHVEGAPLNDMENSKRMRVFKDGSTRDGWSGEVAKVLREAKRQKKKPQPQEGRTALLRWDPQDSYRKRRTNRRMFWEQKCDEALTREGCGSGIIHKGEIAITRNGQETSYVNVEGAPRTDMENSKLLRVFRDGSSTIGWSKQDRVTMTEAKRQTRYEGLKQPKPLEGPDQSVQISWDPVDAYKDHGKRKLFWEQNCAQAFAKNGCPAGIIHQGVVKTTRDGERTNYVLVKVAPSMGMEPVKKMRVFQNGSSEPGWSKTDGLLLSSAQRARLRDQARTTAQKHNMGLVDKGLHTEDSIQGGSTVDASTSAQAPAEEHVQDNSKDKISWSPVDAYNKYPWLRGLYEEACQQALDKEGCDFATIHQGYKPVKDSDGLKSSFYMNVSMGKQGNRESTKYMRLFQDGTYHWYQPGPLPESEIRTMGWSRYRNQLRKLKRLSEDEGGTRTREPLREPSQAPTLSSYPGQFQAGVGEYQYSAPAAHSLYSEPIQSRDFSKRRRVGEGGFQYSGSLGPDGA